MNRNPPSSLDGLSRANPAAHQSGFGLIEMMIAVAISLFILLGLSAVFLNMKQAFGAQNQLAQLQDNERFVLTTLTSTLQQAGFFPNPVDSTAESSLPAVSGNYGSFIAGQGLAGVDGPAGGSDTITSRYVTASGAGVLNCLGAANTSGNNQLVMNTYSISTTNELLCSTDGGTTNTPLVGGVIAMRVVYSVDTAGDGQTYQFLNAFEVTAGAFWPRVKTAHMTVSMLNPFAGQAGQAPTIDWQQTINLMSKS
jgi:type IV pilus assembly protein PilW